MTRNAELGRRGETIAADFLRAAGHRILDRNWRVARGELDLVTSDGSRIVAVEVKTRSSLDFGHPLEAIDRGKLERVHRLGWEWCRAHGVRGDRLRVDAIAVIAAPGRSPVVEHLIGVR